MNRTKPPQTVWVLQEDNGFNGFDTVLGVYPTRENAVAAHTGHGSRRLNEVPWYGPALRASKHGLNAGQFQAWRTPKQIFREAQETLWASVAAQFILDAFADADNALCRNYFDGSEGKDGFVEPWYGYVWANPPYGSGCQERCLEKAIAEVDAGRCLGACLLVQANVSSKWYHKAMRRCVIEPYQGRIQFDLPPGQHNARRSSFSNVLIWVWPEGTNAQLGVGRARSAKTGDYCE
jgi:phage N-6-adenine-methyltransferase